MTRRTKKVGSTGRFGPRYGSQLKKRVLKIENNMHATHRCPSCASPKVKRKSVGIWHCKKCNAKFTGGAYNTQTPRGAESFRIAKRKQRESEVIEE